LKQYSDVMMRAALDIDMPNYANSIIDTHEVVAPIRSCAQSAS